MGFAFVHSCGPPSDAGRTPKTLFHSIQDVGSDRCVRSTRFEVLLVLRGVLTKDSNEFL